MMRKKTLSLIYFLILSMYGTAIFCHAAVPEKMRSEYFTRDKSIYMIHSTDAPSKSHENIKSTPRKANASNLTLLADHPFNNPLLPIKDAVTPARRIEILTRALEFTNEGERTQQIRFNLAYEFFLLYLHFQRNKFCYPSPKDGITIQHKSKIPVSEDELLQYLLCAQYYLKPLIVQEQDSAGQHNKYNIVVQGQQFFKSTDDTSFYARNQKDLYLNVYMLAMMIECEIVAGQWMVECEVMADLWTGFPLERSLSYDTKTWNWLNRLWLNYKSNGTVVSAYAPPVDVLLSLYELYLRYHFLGRYLRDTDEKGPYLDAVTHNLLKRINLLQIAVSAKKPNNQAQKKYYNHYMKEATKDGGKTSFLPGLFFARRGRLVISQPNNTIPKIEIFYFYRALFDKAAEKLKYNIPYRSRIYNEIVLLGLEIDNLRLMEEVLYEYGLMSMRIAQDEDYTGNDLENSSRLTMACLLANILEKKRLSGLNQDLDKYRELANSLCPALISKENNYWEYASIIHSSLASFYSGLNAPLSETFAMYHARQAFLAPCEKVTLTFGDDQWKQFFKLPQNTQAVASLKLFLYFHNKYPTNPYATIPKEYNANKIVNKSIHMDI